MLQVAKDGLVREPERQNEVIIRLSAEQRQKVLEVGPRMEPVLTDAAIGMTITC
jgi:hypothetical protein